MVEKERRVLLSFAAVALVSTVILFGRGDETPPDPRHAEFDDQISRHFNKFGYKIIKKGPHAEENKNDYLLERRDSVFSFEATRIPYKARNYLYDMTERPRFVRMATAAEIEMRGL